MPIDLAKQKVKIVLRISAHHSIIISSGSSDVPVELPVTDRTAPPAAIALTTLLWLSDCIGMGMGMGLGMFSVYCWN